MAGGENYTTHLRLNPRAAVRKGDEHWYRILAFVGPDAHYAPQWLIGEQENEESTNGYGETTEYTRLRWVVFKDVHAFKIAPQILFEEVKEQEDEGSVS